MFHSKDGANRCEYMKRGLGKYVAFKAMRSCPCLFGRKFHESGGGVP